MLKEQEAGEKTADVCRWHGISSATFYKRKSKYGGMEPSDAKRLRALEDKNGKLEKLLAEQMLDNAMLRDISSKNGDARSLPGNQYAVSMRGGKRKAVVHVMDVHQVSQRRACDVLQVDRSSVRYLPRRDDDAEPRDAIKRVSRERRRFGCRRVRVMIAREGFVVNHRKVGRIYTEEKLPTTVQRQHETRLGHEKANGAAGWSEPTPKLGFRV